MDMNNRNNDDDNDVKEALLLDGKNQLAGVGRRSRRLSRKYSLNTLRNEFISRLPDKVRCCVDLESSSMLDLSKASALTQGMFLCFFVLSFLQI